MSALARATEERTPSPDLGRWLKHEREVRQISLEELAQTTRIPLKMLQHLEEDRHDLLPGEVFARGFLRSYARAVGLAESEVVERWSQTRKAPEQLSAPMTAISPPEKSRRFGIAIALVILLILFTLALSIVLRPRHRDAPVELSQSGIEMIGSPRSALPSARVACSRPGSPRRALLPTLDTATART